MIKRQQCLGLNDPETFDSSHNVACVLRKMSRYSEAETLPRQTWNLREHVPGHDNGNTLASKNDLALSLRYHGDIKQALQLHQGLLDHTHHLISETIFQLSICLRRQDKN